MSHPAGFSSFCQYFFLDIDFLVGFSHRFVWTSFPLCFQIYKNFNDFVFLSCLYNLLSFFNILQNFHLLFFYFLTLLIFFSSFVFFYFVLAIISFGFRIIGALLSPQRFFWSVIIIFWNFPRLDWALKVSFESLACSLGHFLSTLPVDQPIHTYNCIL